MTCAPSAPGPAVPRVRFACTTSNPPEPSPRSSASVLTITSSPSATSPISRESAHAGRSRPSTSTRRGSVETTTPRRSLSTSALRGGRRNRLANVEHLDDPPRRHALLRGVVRLGPVREQHGVEAGGAERVRIAPPAGGELARLVPASLERPLGDRDRRRRRPRPVAAEHLGHVEVEVAVALVRRPRAGVHHRPDRVGGLRLVDAPGLALDPAV